MAAEKRTVIARPAGLENSGPVFDRATRLARALFRSADSQITLQTPDGLWRSRPAVRDTEAEAETIAEVMRTGELLWVEDCSQDARYCDDPMVKGPPFVRLFAGAPIRLAD